MIAVTVQVQRGITLVYGGGSSQLMGKVAETVKDAGGRVVGYDFLPSTCQVNDIYNAIRR